MIEWLLWALFSSVRGDQLEEWREELEGYVHVLEDLMGHKIDDGCNAALKCMKVSMDPVVSIHRPFVWYMVRIFRVHICRTSTK